MKSSSECLKVEEGSSTSTPSSLRRILTKQRLKIFLKKFVCLLGCVRGGKRKVRDREIGKINYLVPMELCKKNPTRTTQVIPRSLGYGRIQQYGLELTSCVWCRNRKSFYFKILTHCCRQRKCHRVRFPRQGLHSLPQLGRG